jgi:hypothetical protein
MLTASIYSRSSFRIAWRSWKTASGLTSASSEQSAMRSVFLCAVLRLEEKPKYVRSTRRPL